MYAIMSRDFKSYTHSPSNEINMAKEYDRIKEYVLSKGSPLYQKVLVQHKHVKVGFSIKFRINWRWWRDLLKPEINWKYCRSVSWLIFFFHFENDYDWIPEKIVKDHCKEEGVEND